MNEIFVHCEETSIFRSFFNHFFKKIFNFLLTSCELYDTIQTSVKLEYVNWVFLRGSRYGIRHLKHTVEISGMCE